MALYVLNESDRRDRANDLTVFASPEDLAAAVEPIDVENGEYFVFDTDGQFFDLSLSKPGGKPVLRRASRDPKTAITVVRDYLSRVGWKYDENATLEENAKALGVYDQA